jgi:hypothetical protein
MYVSNGEARADEPDFTVRNLYGSVFILAFKPEAANLWVDDELVVRI